MSQRSLLIHSAARRVGKKGYALPRASARCVIISNETLSFNSAIVKERRNVFSLARKTATVNAAVKTLLPLRRVAQNT